MMLPDPFDLVSLNRPDTEIKLFCVDDIAGDVGGRIAFLKDLRESKRAGASVYHVHEPMLVRNTELLHTYYNGFPPFIPSNASNPL